jgi:uncharacterized surface protein with fasciclin (FAS1) repeats
MTSLTSLNFVKRTAGLLGILAASAAVVLPVAAQMKPQSETLPANPGTSAPAPVPNSQTPGRLTPNPGTANTPGTVTPGTPGVTTPGATTPGMTTPGTTTPGTTTPDTTPGATNPTRPTTPSAESPSSRPSESAATGTIIDVATASGSFTTLVAALNEAELSEVLQGSGPFTVFAPTDAAFEALPDGTVEELLKPENRDTLVKILKYHVVSGAYPSNQLESGEIPTAAGEPVTVSVENGSIKVDDATVTQPDIAATNGVIHPIDRVILPPQ